MVFGTAGIAACSATEETPVYRVDRTTFVHRVTAEGTLKARETTKISVPPTVRQRVRLAWIAAEGTLLESGDLVALFDQKEFEQNLEEAQSDLEGTTHEQSRTEAESDIRIGEFQRDYEVADLELDFARRFQLTDESVFSRHEIAESAIDEDLAGARKGHAESMQEIQRSLATTELEILEIRKRKANLSIDEARAGLDSLEVRAPHAGILTLTRNWRGEVPAVGMEMWRGYELGEIPALDSMEAEVFVLEADAGGLGDGLTADLVIESHPETVLAAKTARVEKLARPRFRGSPVQYFGVTLEFEETRPEIMKPGQRVVATLYLRQVADALVVPRQAVFQDGEEFWVYRRNGSGFENRAVEIGAGSAGLVVIASGLDAGDVVALTQPANVLEASEPGGAG